MKFKSKTNILFSLSFIAYFLISCNNKFNDKLLFIKINPEFATYIAGYTGGIVSIQTDIKIKLTNEIANNIELNKPQENNIIEITPQIKGDIIYTDARTIVFKPKEKLASNTIYKVNFKLKAFYKVKKELEELTYYIKTQKQNATLAIDKLTFSNNNSIPIISGTVITADVCADSIIEQNFLTEQKGKAVIVSWEHLNDKLSHKYTISNIENGNEEKWVTINFKASQIGAEKDLSITQKIYSINNFSFIEPKIHNKQEQYISLYFTQPLLTSQNLDGLVQIEGVNDLKFTIESNCINVYTNTTLTGAYTLKLNEGIYNYKNEKLKVTSSYSVKFEDARPAVRFYDTKGVIMPDSKQLSIPFEAVNINAVDVTIFKLYENNILHFLQQSDLRGDQNMYLLAKKLFTKNISLGNISETKKGIWNRYNIDLSSYFKADPASIYRIKISFKRKYVTYTCLNKDNLDNETVLNNIEEDKEAADSYDYYNDYYGNYNAENYYNDESYNWEMRDNPCNPSYYTNNNLSIAQNFLSSDIGLIVKAANDGNYYVATNSITNAANLPNVSVSFYDHHNQFMGKANTDGNGSCFVKLNTQPAVVIAKCKEQFGYLKLDISNALSFSNFDVSGETVKKGIKGFIYAERGVWRPGDSMYVNFILDDKLNNIPVNFPIVCELNTPQGQLYKRVVTSNSINGFYDLRMATTADAPTGMWNVKIKVGNNYFFKNIRIETIQPNRIKINWDNPEMVLYKSEEQSLSINTAWLHGAPTKNLKTLVEASYSKNDALFRNKYKDYNFFDPYKKFSTEQSIVFDGATDENGNLSFPVSNISNINAPGMLNINFSTRVFETGGNASVDVSSFTYSPFTSYVGIKVPSVEKDYGVLATNKNHEFTFVCIDQLGKLESTKKIKVELFKLEWRWWYGGDDYGDANYVGDIYNEPVLIDSITLTGGKGKYNIKIADGQWGRYYIRSTDLESLHSSGDIVYFDYGNTHTRNQGNENKTATTLNFTSDKTNYGVGDIVKLTIPSAKGSKCLLSIENGSTILKTFWIDGKEATTNFEFEVTTDMQPNVYATITLIQPHAQSINNLPIRMYGTLPIIINDEKQKLLPEIVIANELKPETKNILTVKEKNNQDMTYTVFIVDEGLLDLTKFKTPNAYKFFNEREALGVNTWDVYDYVMGARNTSLEHALAIGGGEDAESADVSAGANRFKPLALNVGTFFAKGGTTTIHTFTLPAYIGSAKVMVVAHQGNKNGQAEKTVFIRKPLMILATLPRVLGPQEEVDLPITIFVSDKKIKNVNVSVSTNNLLQLTAPASQSVSFNTLGDKVINFPLKVKELIGAGKITITAISGNEKSSYVVDINVRNQNASTTNTKTYFIEANKSIIIPYQCFGITGTNKVSCEVSTLPGINLESRLQYLIQYPHGCVEQTTSSVFAQLYLDKVISLNKERKQEVENNIKIAIKKLNGFRTTSGGLSYWPGDRVADAWGTSYAAHFLIESEKLGYQLPYGLKEGIVKYLKQLANTWGMNENKNYNNDLDQAYRLYILALSKNPAATAMNRLRETKALTVAAKWRLAAAYALTGNLDIAKKMIEKTTYKVNAYNDIFTYGSGDRDEAMILETLILLNDKTKSISVFKSLAQRLSSENWYSTQTTCYQLLAGAKYIVYTNVNNTAAYSISYNGITQNIKDNNAKALGIYNMQILKQAKGSVNINNTGSTPLYVNLLNSGTPLAGKEIEASSNVAFTINYMLANGAPLNVSSIEQGTDFIAKIQCSNLSLGEDYAHMALTQIFPSGWEIVNIISEDGSSENSFKNSFYDYKDIRDDRVFTYFPLNRNETKTYIIKLNASYLGNYYLPSPKLEEMYNKKVQAQKKGMWVKVVKAGTSS